MSLLPLYTPDSLKRYSYGGTSTEAKQNKLLALETLTSKNAIIDSASIHVTDDPTLILLHSDNDTNLYGNIINYRERFLR